MRVGFIGLGDQGAPMAAAIARGGFDLRVWARRPQSLEAVRDIEPAVCPSVVELGRQSDLVCLCLREDRDVEDVVFGTGLLEAMTPGSILANHGTGSPDICEEWARRCAAFSVVFLDAPVSGGRVGAQNRALTTMVGGDAQAADRCRPVFESFSRLVVHLGGPGAGQFMKLINNTLTAANFKNAEEALALCDEIGMERESFVEVVQASSGASFALEAISSQMTVDLAAHYTKMVGKDVNHFSGAARSRGIPVSPLEESARIGVANLVAAVNRLHDSQMGEASV
jgi:3-hydroxyisobutyrate dehydrogenase-like beta-hydroxyacid dehydrogenase